jgi:signal transduction histidine kinase
VNEPKEKEYAELVIREVERLEKILRDVLTFSRHARFHLERHTLNEIARETARMFGDIYEEQNIRMEITVEEDLPEILIDQDQVRQALGNLLMNAADAMPEGGLLKIETGKEELHDVPYVFVRVSDSGQGIPEDKLPLIFEPFFSTKEIHGTGLGLSITRKIMEEHCGFVKAESTVGKGTNFSLYFPYQSEEEASEINCWEYMKCGRDKDAAEKCPAYPHFGRTCWAVAGTFCEGKVQGTFAQKYEDCQKCGFYQKLTAGKTGV